MPDLQGYITFPGIDQVIEGSFTLSHGITPSVCTLDIQPQADFVAAVGELVIVFGDVELVFPDCRIDQASFRYGPDGLVWGLSIWDRRWRWQFGDLSGTYNERIPLGQGGSIDAYTLRTPQQLLTLCLLAMGETAFDVSQAPNDSRPEVRWVNEVPARSLAELCDLLDCRVVLGLDNSVRVCRAGVGQDLPSDGVMQDALLFHTPAQPDSITVVCAATRYQADFMLEAVGKDTNGNVVPINQLSYAPKAGWGLTAGTSPEFFEDLAIYAPNLNLSQQQQQIQRSLHPSPRDLACATVFRWYRVSMQAPDQQGKKPQIPGWGGKPGNRVAALWQILPIEDVMVQGYEDSDGLFHSSPAQVYGVWTTLHDLAYQPAPVGTIYDPDAFTIDTDRGIVMFDEQVYILAQDQTPPPPPFAWLPKSQWPPAAAFIKQAQLYLRCAVSVRDPDTSAWDRYRRVLASTGVLLGTPTRVLRHEEIRLDVAPVYGPNFAVKGLTTTEQFVARECDYYLAAAAAEYHLDTPQDRVYMGLRADVAPDGAVQQVTWSVGPRGATTRASRNTEWHPVVPPYRERRQLERLAKWARSEPEMLSLVRDRSGRQPPRGVGDKT